MNDQIKLILDKAALDPKFHKYLIAAQDYRSQGDYSFGSDLTDGQVQDTLKWASEFFATAKAYLNQV